jgi:hypothetical protein
MMAGSLDGGLEGTAEEPKERWRLASVGVDRCGAGSLAFVRLEAGEVTIARALLRHGR